MYVTHSTRARVGALTALLVTLAMASSAVAGSVTPVPITPGAWTGLGAYNGNLNGGPLNSHVNALVVSGNDIYVGGNFFDVVGIQAADYIAKWNGTNWSSLGAAAPFPSGRVNTILVDGPNVYIGGEFSNAGGDPQADYVAKWNGTAWSDVADESNGSGQNGKIQGEVHALAKSGTRLYMGGFFTNVGGVTYWDHLAYWDSSPAGWGGFELSCTVHALAATATDLYLGGCFQNAGAAAAADRLAVYNFASFTFSQVGPATADGALNGTVRAIALWGSNLFAGGDFTDASGITAADYVAMVHGAGWSALGGTNGIGAINNRVRSILVSGTSTYVGGDFTNAGGVPTADHVARWSGSSWSGLGSDGANDGVIDEGGEDPNIGWVRALGLTSNALYVGGNIRNVDDRVDADYISAYGVAAVTNQKPDGRIRKGSGTLVGNNIYNTTGVNQTRSGSAAVNGTITFTVSIQNDGPQAGKFRVAATASGNVNFQVTYFRNTTNITTAVVNGTYVTGSVAPGGTFAITAKVKVTPAVTVNSTATRLITITSNADSSKVDAVKLIGKRV